MQKMPSFSRFAGVLLLFLLVLSPAAGQRLVFQKGAVLYSATETGKEARALFELPDADTPWSVSPDGRRVAWITRPGEGVGTGAVGDDLLTRPVTVSISDLTGRRRKRLFSTATLTDRLDRRINRIGIPARDLPRRLSNPLDVAKDLETFEGWQPHSLSWSADSRTLYLCCYRQSPVVGLISAALTVDATAGTAFVDAEGRWKSLAPLVEMDAGGVLLTGVFAPLKALLNGQSSAGESDPGNPLVVVNTAAATRRPLAVAAKDGQGLPDHAFASEPALAPRNLAIAFAAGPERGLWVTDKFARFYRRMAEGTARRPRWSSDGKLLFFLLPRPVSGQGTPPLDLYAVPWDPDAPEDSLPPAPTLMLQGVAWFDIVKL